MIYTLGESLMDIIFEDKTHIEAKAGGAMLNLAVSLGRCNVNTSLLSELGSDKVADEIIFFLNENNVSTEYITKYKNQVTSIALAFLDENKKPTYSFYKNYPELRRLSFPPKISKNDIIIFGSLYSLDDKIRDHLKQFIIKAKEDNALVIYDPNIRHSHHLENVNILNSIKENLGFADIIKGSDEDFENIFGTTNDDIIINKIKSINNKATIILTKGENGSKIASGNSTLSVKSKPIELVSTVGAGDNFTAGIVYYLWKNSISREQCKSLSSSQLQELLQTGTNFSSEVCTSMENYVSKAFASTL